MFDSLADRIKQDENEGVNRPSGCCGGLPLSCSP